jgi:hypothetical protein
VSGSDAARSFQDDCNRALARVALSSCDDLPIDQRIMINRAIAALFPNDSEIHIQANATADALTAAEKSQLQLGKLLSPETIN